MLGYSQDDVGNSITVRLSIGDKDDVITDETLFGKFSKTLGLIGAGVETSDTLFGDIKSVSDLIGTNTDTDTSVFGKIASVSSLVGATSDDDQ